MKKRSLIMLLMLVLTVVAFSALGSTSTGAHAGLKKLSYVWAITSEHVRTDFTSKSSYTSLVSLDMKLRNRQSYDRKIAFASFGKNGIGSRVFTKEAVKDWSHPGIVPLMIVGDRSFFERRLVSIVLHEHDGGVVHPNWSFVPYHSDEKHRLWWLVIPQAVQGGSYIKLKIRESYRTRQGYFSSFKIRIPRDALIQRISGCIRFPWNTHFSMQAGLAMYIRLLKQPDGRAYGFCYKNGANDPNVTGVTHFVAASTARGWPEVAAAMRRTFQQAEATGYALLPRVMAEVSLDDTADDGEAAIDRARHWVVHNLKYSTSKSLIDAPHSFDEVINDKGGACTDLTMVLTMLLRKEGVEAHPAMTSATLVDAFKFNAADLSNIDHMVVYLPKQKVYLDPDVIHPRALLTHTKRQLLDIVTGMVVAAPEGNL